MLEEAQQSASTDAIRQQEVMLLNQIQTMIENHKDYEQFASEILEAIVAHESSNELATKAFALEKQQSAYNQVLTSFLTEVERMTQSAVNVTENEEQHAITGMLSLVGIALSVGLLIGLFISRQLVYSLRHACEVAEQMADGNFDVNIRADGDDDVGRLLKSMRTMAHSLGDMVSAVMVSADKIADEVVGLSAVAKLEPSGR
ncbi:methyl-accepting chemotaxis protein [Vibrio sp. PP-XX7]